MSDFPSWWRSPEGVLRLFNAAPAPEGWERCRGHYNFETGQWVEPDPLDHDGDGKPGGSTSGGSGEDMKALRAEYARVTGKKPFAGWNAATLRAKML